MELRVLHYFLYVANEGSITKAAKRLHLTQPTLSRQLKQLEEELQCRLFERTPKGLILTSQGQLLKQHALEMFRLEEKIKDEFQQENEFSGTLVIGAGEFQSMGEFAEIVKLFQTNHPAVTVELVSGNADFIQQKLTQGLLDLGIILEVNQKEGYTSLYFETKEQFGVYVDTHHPLATKRLINLADLDHYALWRSKNQSVQAYLVEHLGADYHNKKWIGEYTLLHNCLYFLKQTDQICVSLKLPLQHPDLIFIPFEPDLSLKTIAIYQTNQLRSPLVHAFLEHLKSMLFVHEIKKK